MPLLISTVLSALLLVAGAAFVDPAVRQWRHLILFLGIGLFYGHGPRTAGECARRPLHLDHWGPLGTSGDVEVRNSIYAHTRPGQTICVRTGSGALAIRWYQILPCPNAP